jgi:hypothetical protein
MPVGRASAFPNSLSGSFVKISARRAGVIERRFVRVVASLVIVASLLLTACSSGKSKSAATEAINKGLRRDAIVLFIFVGRVSSRCTPIVGLDENQDLANLTNFHAAQKAGLVTITQDGPGFWKVELVNPRPDLVETLKRFSTLSRMVAIRFCSALRLLQRLGRTL